MIGQPCERCNNAYGHPSACPESVRNRNNKALALADWQRGKNEAENNILAKSEDQKNDTYMLGREIYQLIVQGLGPTKNGQRRPAYVTPKQPKLRLVVPTRADP